MLTGPTNTLTAPAPLLNPPPPTQLVLEHHDQPLGRHLKAHATVFFTEAWALLSTLMAGARQMLCGVGQAPPRLWGLARGHLNDVPLLQCRIQSTPLPHPTHQSPVSIFC